jgi:hypothetical protein
MSHLSGLGPMLFVQGERDALAPLPLIEKVVAGLRSATLEVVADADHGFRVPRRTGIDASAMLDRLGAIVAVWLRGQRERGRGRWGEEEGLGARGEGARGEGRGARGEGRGSCAIQVAGGRWQVAGSRWQVAGDEF